MALQEIYERYIHLQDKRDLSKKALFGSSTLIVGGIGVSTFAPEVGYILSGTGIILSVVLSSIVLYTNREIAKIDQNYISYGSKK